MANLPLDMIADILSRLEVRPLLCFRCVSKTWRKLIDGPDFIKLHLNNSIHSTSNQFLIFKRSKNLYWVSFDSLKSASELDHPLMCYSYNVKLLGSCNGLLCISNIVDDIAFWNPCTRKHRVLPFLSSERKPCSGASVYSCSVYGFGYDLVHEDYKLVRITQFYRVEIELFESEVKVYSLARNYWTRIRDMPYVLRHQEIEGVYARGALHWVVRRNLRFEECNIVVALDLAVEDYKEVPLPKFGDKNFELELGVLGGCLSVVANYSKVRSDVWVMKEYGVENSWTKLFSVLQEQLVGPLTAIRPLGYCNAGSEVLLTGYRSNLLQCDLKKNIVKDVRIRDAPYIIDGETCLQSLVSLNINRGNHGRNQAGDYTKNVKKSRVQIGVIVKYKMKRSKSGKRAGSPSILEKIRERGRDAVFNLLNLSSLRRSTRNRTVGFTMSTPQRVDYSADDSKFIREDRQSTIQLLPTQIIKFTAQEQS